MKVLSIRQPWAWLIVDGWKDIENRTWRTNFRRAVLIHTPAKIEKNIIVPCLAKLPGNLVTSAIIGEVTITGCSYNLYCRVNDWAERNKWHRELSNPIYYKRPILDVKGKLGLWNYDITEEERIERRY